MNDQPTPPASDHLPTALAATSAGSECSAPTAPSTDALDGVMARIYSRALLSTAGEDLVIVTDADAAELDPATITTLLGYAQRHDPSVAATLTHAIAPHAAP